MNGKMQYDAGNTNLKFTVRKKRIICGIWAVFLTAPIAAFLGMYLRNRLAKYQTARIQAMFSGGSETDYLTKMLHSLWRRNKLYHNFLCTHGDLLSTYRYKNIYPRHPEAGFMSINAKLKKVS